MVSFGNILVKFDALVGGRGSGGNFVGLPELEYNIDFRNPTDDADLLRLWCGDDTPAKKETLSVLSWAVPLLYGLGLCIIEPEDLRSPT